MGNRNGDSDRFAHDLGVILQSRLDALIHEINREQTASCTTLDDSVQGVSRMAKLAGRLAMLMAVRRDVANLVSRYATCSQGQEQPSC
jgi:hypothetical protein